MSQENVEIVKAVIEAINREDWDAAFQDAAPGFEFDMSRSVGPYRGVYRLDQARRFVEDFTETLSVRFEADQLIDAGDHVVVLGTGYFSGRDGIETTLSAPGQVWTIRDGALERWAIYQEREDALEAVGLSDG